MKNTLITIITVLSLLLYSISLQAQQGNKTTEGKDFWLSFGDTYDAGVAMASLQIRIAAKEAATVNVEFTANPSVNVTNYSIAAGEVYSLVLSTAQKDAAYNLLPGGVTNKSIHITSTANVAVYILNQKPAATAATNIFPVESVGTEYYHISYTPCNLADGEGGGNYNDGYLLVATEDGTNIYVDGSGTPQVMLNAGEVYTYHWPAGTDGSKTHIKTDKPVAYFVANRLVLIPRGRSARDPLYTQFPPLNQWGTQFFVPMTVQQRGRVRIMASQDGTNLTVSPSLTPIVTESYNTALTTGGQPSLTGLNAGEYVELEIGVDGCFISSNKPVGVCAYMVGLSYVTSAAGLGSEAGDPAMAWIPPIEQSLKEILIAPFFPTGTSNLTQHYALIVTPTATKSQTTMTAGTDAPIAPAITWVDNAAAGFSYGSYQLTQNAAYRFANPEGLVVNGYGIGNIESYYYLAGAAARSLDVAFYVNDIHYQDVDTLNIYCADTLKFRSEIRNELDATPGHLRWFVDGVEKNDVQDKTEWTLTEDELTDYYNTPHTYSLIVKGLVLTDTLTTSFSVIKEEIPLTIIPPTTEFYVTLQSSVPPNYADYMTSTGFEYRKLGDTAWIPLEADNSFTATTPNLNSAKWEFRAVLETSTDCGTIYSEVKGLVIACDCD